jgi:KaiC/GvpD/RAD55 family RecA-like ATPase
MKTTKLETFKEMEVKMVERIGGIIPKGKLTLITGIPGTGKTFTTIKLLNQAGVVPIFINLDESPIEPLKAKMYGSDLLLTILDENIHIEGIEPSDVIIIDTYERMESMLGSENEEEEIYKKLDAIVRRYGVTLIIIGHTEHYASSRDTFSANKTLDRRCYERIHFDTKISKGKEQYTTHIRKGRGYEGNRILVDFLRDDTTLPIDILTHSAR